MDYAEPGQRALLVEGIRPVLPLIRNTPYGKRIQNKLQRENSDGFGGYHASGMAVRTPNMGLNSASHGALHPGNHLDNFVSQNGLYNHHAPSLQGQGLMGHNSPLHNIQPHSIDGYVLQNHSSHSPGMTPPHTHAGFAGSYAGVNSFPAVGLSGAVNDPYQQANFGYSM